MMAANGVANRPWGGIDSQYGRDFATDDPGALEVSDLEKFLFDIRNQPEWRLNADKEADYYDGNQLDQQTMAELIERGMAPIITNLIKPTVDAVLGMEAKTRTDWHVVPENDDGDADMAEALNMQLDDAERESHANKACADAYASQVKVGIGWVEVSRETDPFKYQYRVVPVHRREIQWDWRSTERLLNDARYLVRRRWMDLDQAQAMFPEFKDLLQWAITGWTGWDAWWNMTQDLGLARSWDIERGFSIEESEWRQVDRKRCCMFEIWYRVWKTGHVLKLPNGRVVEFDINNHRHVTAVATGMIRPQAATYSKVRQSWWVGPHRLVDRPTPYPHNYFPYVPFFGFREDKTNVPYGLIRAMISPQDEVNARKSKMMWLLTAKRVIADDDAVEDHNKAADEVARADAYIILNSERKSTSQFQVETDFQLSTQQFEVMKEAKQEIQESSGIFQQMLGNTQASVTSGVAINQLVEQGTNTLGDINDNYREARRQVGQLLLELVKEDLTQPKQMTIGEGENQRQFQMNQPGQDLMGNPVTLNDPSKSAVKVVLEDVPSTPSYKQQQLMLLTELTKALPPEMQMLIMDFVVDGMTIPHKTQIVERIRQKLGFQPNGQAAPPPPPNPQELAQMAMIHGKLSEMNAKVDNLVSQTKLNDAKAAQAMGQTLAAAVNIPVLNDANATGGASGQPAAQPAPPPQQPIAPPGAVPPGAMPPGQPQPAPQPGAQ